MDEVGYLVGWVALLADFLEGLVLLVDKAGVKKYVGDLRFWIARDA